MKGGGENPYGYNGDNRVRVWNLEYKRQEAVLQGHTSQVDTVIITDDNKYVLSRSLDKTVIVWNLQDKRQEIIIDENNSQNIWIRTYPIISKLLN